MSKKLLQEAVAEAKTIRETAIRNAYKTLEENLTPSIKEMLASKLEEGEDVDLEECEEEAVNEDVNAGFKKVTPKKKQTVTEEEEGAEPEEEEADEEVEDEPTEEDEEPVENEPAEEPETVADEDAELADDTPIKDMTLGDLKNLLATMMNNPAPEVAPEGEEGADMEPGDVEGMGDEEVPLEGEPEGEPAEPEANPADNAVTPEEEADDEIDISEILKELESEDSKDARGKYTHGTPGNQDHEQEHIEECDEPECKDGKKPCKDCQKYEQELEEAYRVIRDLKSTLSETNLLNGKLLYTSKLLRDNNLSESQKAKVLQTLDGAKDTREVKLVYKTLCESLGIGTKKTVIKEHKAIASRSAGRSTASKAVVEDSWVRRMQQLAGIID